MKIKFIENAQARGVFIPKGTVVDWPENQAIPYVKTDQAVLADNVPDDEANPRSEAIGPNDEDEPKKNIVPIRRRKNVANPLAEAAKVETKHEPAAAAPAKGPAPKAVQKPKSKPHK